MKGDPITARMDAALEKVAARKMEVRAIYLDPADHAAFVREVTRYWRKELKSNATFWPTTYGDHFIRQGKASIIYSIHGVGVTIPKRLSPRVKQAA